MATQRMKPARTLLWASLLSCGLMVAIAPTITRDLASVRPSATREMPKGYAQLAEAGPTGTVPPSGVATPAAPRARGNPLWSIPLATLSATRERPLFSPSRRPRLLQLAAAPSSPAPTGDQNPRPSLTLVGAIAGDAEGMAIFLDNNSKRLVRLKTGESHSGWILQLVQRREVVLQRGQHRIILPLATTAAQ